MPSTATTAVRRYVRRGYGQFQRLANQSALRRDHRDMEHLAMLLPWTLRTDSNCIDVGAHTGTVLRRCVDLAPRGRHVAFEPIPELAANLRSQFRDVTVVEAAVYDEVRASTPFNHYTAAPALSGLTKRPPGRLNPHKVIDVRQTTLDASVPDDYTVDFLKIDVEGAELGVLKGGAALIARSDPVVFVELGQTAAEYYGSDPSALLAVLHSMELQLFDIDGAGPYRLAGLTERWDARDMWNFVAHR